MTYKINYPNGLYVLNILCAEHCLLPKPGTMVQWLKPWTLDSNCLVWNLASYFLPIIIMASWASYFTSMFSSVQFSHSVMSDSATPQIAARQASLSITNSWSLLKLMSIESVMPSSHLILCHPLLLLPPIPPSIRFQWVNSSHEVVKVLEFQLQRQSFQRTPRTDLL